MTHRAPPPGTHGTWAWPTLAKYTEGTHRPGTDHSRLGYNTDNDTQPDWSDCHVPRVHSQPLARPIMMSLDCAYADPKMTQNHTYISPLC